MNREDIIRMAIEAELNLFVNDLTEKQYIEVIEHFAALVASAEREACAIVCDDLWEDDGTAYECAEAIRAMGNVATNDTSQERVDETTKQRHDTPPQPVIDKSAAVRIATALGWTPQRTWVGLTDEEIVEISIKSQEGISPHDDTLRFARAIEAAHGITGEKNGTR